MSFIKLGEAIEINRIENAESCLPALDPQILENFKKMAANLRKVAPRAEDFLYFSAAIIHAAEASAINDDGTPKLTIRGEPVQVGWDTSGGTWRWTSNDPNIKPYKNNNCLVAGTKILMSDGSIKNIENIVVGDEVITHTGVVKKVLEVSRRPYNGKLLAFKIKNNEKIFCTPEHPFYHVNLDGFYSKGLKVLSERKKNNENFRTTFKFSEANKLSVGDLLVSPVLHQKTETDTINPNKAKLLGIFAAEGSFTKKYDKRQGIKFTLGIDEVRTAQNIKEVFEEEFPECSVRVLPEPERSVISVSATGANIAEYFFYHIGEYSHEKILSKELVFAPDDCKKAFLSGYIDGDGCLTDYNKLIVITVSPHLAYQTRTMLNAMGVGSSLRKKDKCKRKINEKYREYDCREHYRIEIYGNAYKTLELEKYTNKYKFGQYNHKIFSNFEKDFCLHAITAIEEQDFVGDVFNFEVEDDHSYVANGIVSHNCDIFPEQELVKAYKKWIGKPLCIDHKSSSVDHTRGFIVDTYYDRVLKRVIALCALDKVNYPELARKVGTGMQTACSMGTAVGRAICTDCGRVARAEQDFCDHMRRKTCYGEINIDLNPIELSIVINGADPKAHIKHIIAAANTLNTYVENKAKELNKLADLVFSANLSVNDSKTLEGNKTASFTVQANDIEQFKTDLDEAFQKLSEINASAKISPKDTNDLAFNQSSGTVAMDEGAVSGNDDSGLSPPHARFASIEEDTIASLREVTAAIEAKLNQMKQSLDKLVTRSPKVRDSQPNTYEETMSGSNDMNKQAYFQGTEEPTPGQPKYPKDPTQEKLREHEDKHMVGQTPFPSVGPVDGMHPSPESAEPSDELERKKMLARAEAEERRLKRAAIVEQVKKSLEEKKAYYQGGGGVNEPAPHKVKYPKDGLQEDVRDHEDKQMVGQKPFPGVGPVDGMHPSPDSAEPSDELKRKQMLQRASLRARFVKAANEDGSQNLGKSAWEVFLGDKLLLTASVEDLSGGRSEMMYDSIATKDFGAKLIDKVKTQGSEKVAALYKSAQALPPAPELPVPPAEAPMSEDTGKEGDPKATAVELVEKVRDLVSDLVEAVRALTGEQAEMGEMAPEMGAAASDEAFGTNTLNTFRKELNGSLTQAMNETISELKDHQQELEIIAGLFDKGGVNDSNKDVVAPVIEDAFNETKTAVADGFKLMTAFIKYARGTNAIVKRAEMEAELAALAKGDDTMTTEKDSHSNDDLMSLIQDTNADLDAVHALMVDDNAHHDSDTESDSTMDADVEAAAADANDLMAKPEELKDLQVKPGTEVKVVASIDYDTKESRAALRAKLAADALGKQDDGQIHDMSKEKFSDMLDHANRLTDGQTHLDVKPSDHLGLVETLPEVNKEMMDVAKAPPKVRKDAEAIQKMVSEGNLDPKDVDELVAHGLDKDAVAYWKKYYGQIEGGSEFASELVKEHAKAKLEEELNKFKVKMGRAYELAYDMVERGLCHSDRTAVSAQVEEIMNFDDTNFQTLKNVVARHTPIHKSAGRMPQVSGMVDLDEVKSSSQVEGSLQEQLSAAFSKTSKRMF